MFHARKRASSPDERTLNGSAARGRGSERFRTWGLTNNPCDMRQAFSLALTLAVVGAFFPTIVPKIEAVLVSGLDLVLQIFSTGSNLIGA